MEIGLFALLFVTLLALVPVTSDDLEVRLMLSACDGQEKLCFNLTVNSSRELGELSFLFAVNSAPFTILRKATGDEQASISGNTAAGYMIQFASNRRVCLQAQLMLITLGPFSSNKRCLSPRPVRGPEISPTPTLPTPTLPTPTTRLPITPTPTAPPSTTPAVNTSSSNGQDFTPLIVVACIVGVVVFAVIIGIIIAWRVRCVREKCKRINIVSTLGKKLGIFTTENDTLNEVQAQDQCECGPTPSETSQEVNGSTTQEKEPDGDVTETSFRHSEGEGSTREAGAEELNSSMNEPDTETKDNAEASVDIPKYMKAEVEVEVHPNDPPNEVQPQGQGGYGPTPAAASQGPRPVKDTNEPPVPMTDEVESEAVSVEEAPDSVVAMSKEGDNTLSTGDVDSDEVVEPPPPPAAETVDETLEVCEPEEECHSVTESTKAPASVGEMSEEGSYTTTKENVVSNEQSRVDQLPPPAAEAVDETVKECEPEGLENYAKDHTKKVDEGGDDKYNARRVPKTATNRSRSNTENSEEQKPTFASGPDASGGSDDCADGHIDPEKNSAPEAETGGTKEIVGIQKCVETKL